MGYLDPRLLVKTQVCEAFPAIEAGDLFVS